MSRNQGVRSRPRRSIQVEGRDGSSPVNPTMNLTRHRRSSPPRGWRAAPPPARVAPPASSGPFPQPGPPTIASLEYLSYRSSPTPVDVTGFAVPLLIDERIIVLPLIRSVGLKAARVVGGRDGADVRPHASGPHRWTISLSWARSDTHEADRQALRASLRRAGIATSVPPARITPADRVPMSPPMTSKTRSSSADVSAERLCAISLAASAETYCRQRTARWSRTMIYLAAARCTSKRQSAADGGLWPQAHDAVRRSR